MYSSRYYSERMQQIDGWAITYSSDNWDVGYLTLLRMDTQFIIHSKN